MYPGIRKSGMAAPVCEAITDTHDPATGTCPDHTRFVSKKAVQKAKQIFTAALLPLCSAPPATRDTSTRPILGPVNP